MEELSEYIQKHFAWIIAAIIAIGSVVSNLIITKRRARKELSYRVVTDSLIISKSDQQDTGIQVFHNNKSFESVSIVEIEIKNSGAKEIDTKDFAEPISIEFKDASEILECSVRETQPSQFKPTISKDGTVITIAPTLMNANDKMLIRVILPIERRVNFELKARISGVSAPTRHFSAISYRPRFNAEWVIGAFGGGGISLAAGLASKAADWVPVKPNNTSLAFMIFFGLSAGCIATVVLSLLIKVMYRELDKLAANHFAPWIRR